MRISAAFPSKYLTANDLQGRRVTVHMGRIFTEKMGDGAEKPILYFQGKDKGLVLNKTNATAIAEVYGDETENWFGKPIVLFEMRVEYQGRMTNAVRIDIPSRSNHDAPPNHQPTHQPAHADAEHSSPPARDEYNQDHDYQPPAGYQNGHDAAAAEVGAVSEDVPF